MLWVLVIFLLEMRYQLPYNITYMGVDAVSQRGLCDGREEEKHPHPKSVALLATWYVLDP